MRETETETEAERLRKQFALTPPKRFVFSGGADMRVIMWTPPPLPPTEV